MFLNLSLRTRLIVAFLLLSVLPLSAVTLYSYTTSVRAFQHAVEREANGTATDISRRMELVTTDVGQRLDQLFESSAAVEGSGTGPPDAVALRARVAPMLGDTAALIDQVEFRPMGTDGQSPAPAPPPPAARGKAHPPVPPPPAVAGAPAPPRPPIVVNVPEILAQAQKQIPKDLSGQLDPHLNEMIRRSVETGLASADVGAKAAAAAMAHEAQLARAAERMTVQMQGRELQIPVQRNGRMIGHARARLNMDRTLGAILTLARSEQGEIAFAIDPPCEITTRPIYSITNSEQGFERVYQELEIASSWNVTIEPDAHVDLEIRATAVGQMVEPEAVRPTARRRKAAAGAAVETTRVPRR